MVSSSTTPWLCSHPLDIKKLGQEFQRTHEKYNFRQLLSIYVKKVANSIEIKQKGIRKKRDWNRKIIKLKVGRSSVNGIKSGTKLNKEDTRTWSFPSGFLNGWYNSFCKENYEGMDVILVMTDGDLPVCLKTLNTSRSKKDSVENLRNEITVKIEEELADRGKLWGLELEKYHFRHPRMPYKKGHDASLIYVAHRYNIGYLLKQIERVSRKRADLENENMCLIRKGKATFALPAKKVAAQTKPSLKNKKIESSAFRKGTVSIGRLKGERKSLKRNTLTREEASSRSVMAVAQSSQYRQNVKLNISRKTKKIDSYRTDKKRPSGQCCKVTRGKWATLQTRPIKTKRQLLKLAS